MHADEPSGVVVHENERHAHQPHDHRDHREQRPDLTRADVRKHLKEFGYSGTPAILDSNRKLVRAAGATVTPEAAVIGPSGQVLYRGRIDNVYASLGKRRPEATEMDLRKALEETLSGKPVSTPVTKAIGCYIPTRAFRQTE